MDPYALIPLTSCVLCTALCLSVWSGPATLEDHRRRSWLRGLIALLALFTGLGVLFRLGLGAHVDAWALHGSALALIAVGPTAIETAFAFSLRAHTRARRWSWVLHGIGALLFSIELQSQSAFTGLVGTRFGIQAAPGPTFVPIVTYVITCAVVAYLTLSRALRDSPDFDARTGPFSRALRGSVAFTIATASVTDVLLPLAGIEAPRLNPAGIGLIAASLLWSLAARGGPDITATPALISEHILHALNEGVAFLDVEGRVLLANESLGHLVGEDAHTLVGRSLAPQLPDFDLGDPRDRLDVERDLHDVHGHTRPISLSVSTVRDGRGGPLGRVIVLRDVRELKTLKNRLVMSGRLAAVGQMAAGIAHEINNPISFVRTNLGVLGDHWRTFDAHLRRAGCGPLIEEILKDGEELIGESIEGVDRAAAIVRDVRELSHAGSSGRVHGNVNHILERVIRLVASEMGPGISIERRFGEGCRAHVSPDQMTQVFVNLLTNAIHAVDGRGHVVIESRRHEDRVEISVIDDGAGVPEQIRDRIFDPFYTTKEVGDGTGLGLSISHEIVRGHGGELIYAPNPDGGARFTVYLEASPSDAESVVG